MKRNIQILQNIVSRKGSSKILTFSMPHVFKALQLLYAGKYVSRATFAKEIHLGDGAVKTLILHLKEAEIADSMRAGTFLTKKGLRFVSEFQKVLPNESILKKSEMLRSKFNHAILIKNYADSIKSGMEQRDYAIMYGASGCTTILFKSNKFVFPGSEKDCFVNDAKTRDVLLKEFTPEEKDVVIISSSDDPFVAEISAKNSALWTLATG
ncbi:MAG: hypothetical protein KC483_05480 [Nitrosarchaeum sp.]|nr:hypothetical protein [Nitrosarchaeum sp.]